MSVAIINYGSGNLRSAAKAFERAARDSGKQMTVQVTDDPQIVAQADRIVLPGVGAFGDCIDGLSGIPGMRDALEQAVHAEGRPFLGICVGMQLLADSGLEHGRYAGLGWIGGEVVAIPHTDPAIKIPHMGWNTISLSEGCTHPVMQDLDADGHGYFVHSYHFRAANPADILAVTGHGGPVTAAVGRDNVIGVQFHPEKSQALGLKLIANFLGWCP